MKISRYGSGIKAMLLFLPCLLLSAITLNAQNVKLDLNAPNTVEAGKPFTIEYKLNAKPDNFNSPSFTGVNVIAGPTLSQGQTVMIANGKSTTEVSFTYTYLLQASEAGKVNIPAASAVVEGKTYSSRTAIVEVVAAGSSSSGAAGQQQGGQSQSSSVARDDVLVRAIVSNTNVYKGEPIKVSFKVYTRVQLAGLENATYPAFNGFWTQQLDASGYEWQSESYNNKVYQTKIINEYLLFPQQAGTLQVEQSEYTFVVQIVTENRRQSIFDDFFSMPNVQQVRHNTVAQPIRITVKDLPAGAPASFNGAVGKFTMTGGLSASEITANSSANFDITISGSGNLPLVNAPKLELPTSFEQYAVKTSDNYRATSSTITGSKQFTIPFIARAEGKYSIPAVEFSYFDPQAARYVTQAIDAAELTITPDASGGGISGGIISGMSKEDLKILGSDIRFIRLGNPQLRETGSLFLWSWGYILLLVVIIIAFVAVLKYMQAQMRFRSNATLVKSKRAHKIARKRLKAAEKGLQANNKKEFYEEMLKALWGYMSDKLNIPVADLSRSKIKEELLAKGVDENLVTRYVDVIAECEYAQYAPAATTQIGDVYKVAEDLISKLEPVI